MSYVNYEEVITRYPIIKTYGKTETEVNSDLIYYSDIELNGMLGSHFSVPFSDSHPTVKDLTIELCYYRAIRTKDPKKAELIHDAVIGRIEKIKKGEELIYTGSGTVIYPDASEQEVWSTTMDYHPVHSMLDAASPYTQVDSSLLDALESERS